MTHVVPPLGVCWDRRGFLNRLEEVAGSFWTVRRLNVFPELRNKERRLRLGEVRTSFLLRLDRATTILSHRSRIQNGHKELAIALIRGVLITGVASFQG